HPVPVPGVAMIEHCRSLPKSTRNHVYIFLMNGVDPLGFSNLSGVRDYLLQLGFIKTYYGQCYHKVWFADEIRGIHQEDPYARFVLIGFSSGADKMRCLARTVQDEGVRVDLLICLGARVSEKPYHDLSGKRGRVINIQACDSPGADPTSPEAESLQLS